MTDRLPHVREPSSGEPDICIYCREEWVDLLTLYETDECSVRLRAEVERLRSINDEYLLEMGRQHAKLREQALEAKRERAAVVAYLTGENEARCRFISDGVAMRIERGEHRREEG